MICSLCRGAGEIQTVQAADLPVARDYVLPYNPAVKGDALNNVISPSEILVGTQPTLLADLTFARGRAGILEIYNLGAASIFLAYSLSNAQRPALLTTNGSPILANSGRLLDNVGGLAVWAVAAAAQSAGAGTRVIGGYYS